MKKRQLLALGLAALLALGGCSFGAPPAEDADQPDTADQTDGGYPAASGTHHAEIAVKDYGTIKVELDGDTAPLSVGNFIGLAEDGFYDGLTFHRIIDGFMIQGGDPNGGDPNGDGTGSAAHTIKGEFANNGVENGISHVRGTISMARATDPDSASSQFFIVHADSPHLDGDYAAFGHVTEGMEIVDEICSTVTAEPVSGAVASADQPVIESIKVVD